MKMQSSKYGHAVHSGMNCLVYLTVYRASLVAQTVKDLHAMRERWVRSLGQNDPLEKEMATHSSIRVLENPMVHGNPLQYSCLENPMD